MIRIVFVEASSGRFLGESQVAPDQIPSSFEAYTQVHLSGAPWEVVRAEPMTRAAAVEMGQIKLSLRRLKLDQVAPEHILYSLPTINDVLPPIAAGTSKLDKHVLELGEDDWRQIELVSRAHEQGIRAGCAAIERIFREARLPMGAFEWLHVRTEVREPLADRRITTGELRSRLGATGYEGLAYRGVAGLIEGGFALEARSGLQLYGTERAGLVTTVGLVMGALGDAIAEEAAALAVLMREHDLVLVDWCRARQIDAASVQDYLTR